MKMVKKIILILGAFIVASLIAGCAQQGADSDKRTGEMATPDPVNPATGNTDTTGDIQGGEETAELYTLEDIAAHDNEDSCWIAVDGKVYDVTEFIGPHPGGTALLEGCGMDSTDLYETRPMGSGTPHSSKARQLLDDFYIGDLS